MQIDQNPLRAHSRSNTDICEDVEHSQSQEEIKQSRCSWCKGNCSLCNFITTLIAPAATVSYSLHGERASSQRWLSRHRSTTWAILWFSSRHRKVHWIHFSILVLFFEALASTISLIVVFSSVPLLQDFQLKFPFISLFPTFDLPCSVHVRISNTTSSLVVVRRHWLGRWPAGSRPWAEPEACSSGLPGGRWGRCDRSAPWPSSWRPPPRSDSPGHKGWRNKYEPASKHQLSVWYVCVNSHYLCRCF